MQSRESLDRPIEIEVENIGGISETTIEIEPGTTILSGRNATNRTSFLQAIMAVHGSTNISLKSDSDEGHVRMTVGETTYEHHFERKNDQIGSSGNPILDDSQLADLFAFLLQSNEARRAVEQNRDLHDVIMQPVDTKTIEAEVEDLKEERRQIDDQLDDLDRLKQQLPDLEAERARLQDELETKRAELKEKRAELDAADETIEEKREVNAQLETELDKLWDARADLEDVEYDLETERETVASLEAEQEDPRDELDSLSETPVEQLRMLEDRLDDLHDRKQSITTDLNQLQTIIQFNQEMLEEPEHLEFSSIEGSAEGSITDQLVDDTEPIICWTCGSTVEKERISEMLEKLQMRRQEKIQERNDVNERIQDVKAEKGNLEAQQRQRQTLERQMQEREQQIERRTEKIEELEARRESLQEQIEELETNVESLREEEQSTILDLHQEVTQLEFEVEQLEDEITEIEAEMESLDAQLANRDELENRREELNDQLANLRTRVERTEKNAIDAFNTHIDAVLDQLEYANIERIWIERTEREVRDGRQNVTKGEFDLHIVRESESGSAYEDIIENLSESEREVIGLVFALAGYLVHDVHETVPFMLLDSLEALDSERIADLVEYLNSYADNLVVALLPEDAAAIDEKHSRITDI